MENLDSALDELGMLSSVTCYKLDYLKVGSGEFEEKHLLKTVPIYLRLLKQGLR